MELEFNRNPVFAGAAVDRFSEADIKASIGLWRASLDDAVKYGGSLTRMVLGKMNLRGDKKYIIVDVKVHMLVKGFMPAIPGWHTDGVPRFSDHWNISDGVPSLAEQADWEDSGEPVSPRYHLYVSGSGCLTKFITDPITLDVPESGSDTYANISKQVNLLNLPTSVFPGQIIEWDWWNLHTAVPAQKREWRYLCRVTETDHKAPNTDLREVLRTQEQVYVPTEFGW